MLISWRPRRTLSLLLLGLAATCLAGCPQEEPPRDPGALRRPPREPREPREPPRPPTGETPTDTSPDGTKPTERPTEEPQGDQRKFPAAAPAALHRLVESDDWQPAEPPKNAQGMWEAEHAATGLTFIHVPAGSFTMGDELGASDAQPVRRVTVRAFLLCKTEVSQQAWDELGGADDRTEPGANLPINRVNWNEARVWCQNAGFRLPTEAEWEYAARAGGPRTWVSGTPNAMGEHAWFAENGNNELHPVATKRPNKWGFHDMAGNVAEWCQDIYADYAGAPTDGSAATKGGSMRVQRGGNYSGSLANVGSCYRDRSGPHSRYGGPGVRPAVTLP